MRVLLRGGTYWLDQPIGFGPEDSGSEQAPVLYAAASGEQVVISGGRRLPQGRWGEINNQKAWVVDLPEVKEGRWRFRQLFVNGERRPRTTAPAYSTWLSSITPNHRRTEWKMFSKR